MNTRRIHAGAVIAITTFALVAVSACGGSGESENVSAAATPAAAPTSATMSTPSNPAALATPSTAEQPPSTAERDTEEAAPTTAERQLPTSAGDYSEAFMQAWTGGDKAAMATYATADVVEKMSAVTQQGALLRTICEDDKCSYTEENGGRVTLTLDLAKVDSGAVQGITAVKLDL